MLAVYVIDLRSEEQLQLVEREEIDDEEDLFEAIDKCKCIHTRFFLCVHVHIILFNFRLIIELCPVLIQT